MTSSASSALNNLRVCILNVQEKRTLCPQRCLFGNLHFQIDVRKLGFKIARHETSDWLSVAVARHNSPCCLPQCQWLTLNFWNFTTVLSQNEKLICIFRANKNICAESHRYKLRIFELDCWLTTRLNVWGLGKINALVTSHFMLWWRKLRLRAPLLFYFFNGMTSTFCTYHVQKQIV